MIIQALASTNNNRTRAARMLGISRRTLYRKLSKYRVPGPKKPSPK
jgi:DNA-binding NtrC family response regulator